MKYRIFLFCLLTVTACAVQTGPPTVADNGRPLHHTPDGFKNPYPVDNRKRSFFSYWYMRMFEEEFADHEADAHRMPWRAVDTALIGSPAARPRLTWIGHATFLIQVGNINLLTDPHFSDRASPFPFAGPKRLVPLPLSIEQLPEIDYVLISHNHYDQLDRETVLSLGETPDWLVPLGLKRTLVDWGIDPRRITELDWWQQHREPGIIFTATPAHHWSARGLFDRNKTLWSSWMVEIEDYRLWFGGDTAYNPIQFKQIGERFTSIDLALIPIGAYAPRWFMQDSHVTPEEALKIHEEIRSKRSYAMHWGTFQLTAEPMMEPADRLKAALDSADPGTTPFETLAIGETVVLRSAVSTHVSGQEKLP